MCTFHFPNLQNNPCLVYGAKKKFAKHVCFKFNLPNNKLKYSIPFQATFSGYTNTNLLLLNEPLWYCSVPKGCNRSLKSQNPDTFDLICLFNTLFYDINYSSPREVLFFSICDLIFTTFVQTTILQIYKYEDWKMPSQLGWD